MSKSTKKERGQKQNLNEFDIINLNAAGIDISSKDHVVSVPKDREKNNIRTFGAFTCDLYEIAKWLISCNIETVAIESTSFYWKELFLVLQEHGLEVFLVNSRHVKNVTGKKTDEEDAHWIMRLHTCGLLTNSFQPPEEVRTIRELLRHRNGLKKQKSQAVNKMTKSLNTMNIKLNMVLSDLTSVSGQNIISAINKGERNPENLVRLVHHKVKATKEELTKACQGIWRKECLFELKQASESYSFVQKQINECDKMIEEQLEIIAGKYNQGDITDLKLKANKSHSRKNDFRFNPIPYIQSIMGIDASQIYGFSEETVLTLFSEVGAELSCFGNANRFASWTGLAPNNKISGGKIISSRLPKKNHKVKTALIHAANSLYRSDNVFGHYYRRLKSRLGPKAAKCAMARKMAIIYYNMVTKQQEFNPELFEENQSKFKEKRIKFLEQQLSDLKKIA